MTLALVLLLWPLITLMRRRALGASDLATG